MNSRLTPFGFRTRLDNDPIKRMLWNCTAVCFAVKFWLWSVLFSLLYSPPPRHTPLCTLLCETEKTTPYKTLVSKWTRLTSTQAWIKPPVEKFFNRFNVKSWCLAKLQQRPSPKLILVVILSMTYLPSLLHRLGSSLPRCFAPQSERGLTVARRRVPPSTHTHDLFHQEVWLQL